MKAHKTAQGVVRTFSPLLFTKPFSITVRGTTPLVRPLVTGGSTRST